MQLTTGHHIRKLPVDHCSFTVAFRFDGFDLPEQTGSIANPSLQTALLKHSNEGFSHIQPAGVLGREMKAYLSHYPPGLLRGEGLIQRSRFVGVEIILDYINIFRVRITFVHQPLDALGVILVSPPFGDDDVAVAALRLDHHKQIERAIAFVFMVFTFHLPRHNGQALTSLLQQLLALFIETDLGMQRVILHFVQFQHFFHCRYEGRPDRWDAPLFFAPGLKFVFFKTWRMV